MRIKLKLFAYLRETLGIDEREIEIKDRTTVSELWESFRDKLPPTNKLRVLFAVNGEYVDETRELNEGDEVVFIPPVSGG